MNHHYFMELSVKDVATEAPNIGIAADMWATSEQARAVAAELGKLARAVIDEKEE